MSTSTSWRPTDTWVRALLPAVAIFFAASIDRNYQTDLWHHLARGRVIVNEGQLLNEDRFTYTVHGQTLIDVNWGSQVIFYHLHQLGGLPLLQTVNALIHALVMFLVVWHCQRRSQSWLIAMGLGLFTFLGLWQLILIRPQTFSLLLFVLLYLILEGSERRCWLLIFPPIIQAMWVNLHGAFPIGLVLIGCYLFGIFLERVYDKRWGVLRDGFVWCLFICLLASTLATFVNPYGLEVIRYVGTTSGRAAARKIDEWLPPGLNSLIGILWAISLLGLIVLLALPGKRPRIRDVCLLLCFLIPTFNSVRMIAWWLLILAPIVSALSIAYCPRLTDQKVEPSLGAMIVCMVFLGLCVWSVPWLERWNPIVQKVRSPHRIEYDLQKVADYLRTQPSGNVFTRFEWAEYLTWALPKGYRIHMDGRIEIIPDAVWWEYTAITQGHADWQKILDRYQVQYLVLDKGTSYHGRLLPVVEKSSRWQQVKLESGNVMVFGCVKANE